MAIIVFMEKRKAAVFLDNTFLIIGIWLLCYLWTRYYVMNLLVALIAATAIALCVTMLINLKRTKNRQTRKKQKHIDNIMNQFLYGGKDFAQDFLFLALNNKFSDAISQNNNAKKHEGFVLVRRTAVFARFFATALSLEQLIDCYVAAKKAEARRMIILTLFGADKTAGALRNSLPDIKLDIFDKNKSYDFFGWLESFPEIKIQLTAQKLSPKKVLIGALNQERSKNYLIISVVLLISSYFVAYPIYYMIMASVTFLLAIIARLNIAKKLSKNQ